MPEELTVAVATCPPLETVVSAFALNITRNVAVTSGKTVCFFSLEMTSVELTDRLIATESGISSEKLKGKQKMLPEEWLQLEQSAGYAWDGNAPEQLFVRALYENDLKRFNSALAYYSGAIDAAQEGA